MRRVLFLGVILSALGAAWADDEGYPFPEHYREWVYLASGVDMSYRPTGEASSTHTFENVFVNPEAYKGFLRDGTWPDKTLLVLEIRRASQKGSINQNGFFQSPEVRGIELHVKDKQRFGGDGWAFVGFNGNKGRTIPRSADCYSCHEQHGAVDTTFVQFYPTLLEASSKKK